MYGIGNVPEFADQTPITIEEARKKASLRTEQFRKCCGDSTMEQKLKQRICIEFCAKIQISATETIEMLNKAFPDDAPKRTTVFEWHSRFKAGRISIEYVLVKDAQNFKGLSTIYRATRGSFRPIPCSIFTYQQVIKQVLQYGSPKRLLTDRAPAFTSPKFRSFLLNRSIHPFLTSSNNPQANGLCQRLNATLTGKLTLLHLENPKVAWTKLVKRVTTIYNNAPHSITGIPPIYLMLGVLPPELSYHTTPYPDIDRARKIAHTRTQNKYLRDKHIYDQRHKQPHFEVGDLVLVKIYHHPNTWKLAPYFTGPYTILEIISPNLVRIDRPNQPLQRDTDTVYVN
ncbi:hypothetical protein LAZ67_X003123 [Cordylochernes scorpioides]|uniref:Integrase catalytic domain-containing protein n=1 Tax=Cordylochernes scorpioides TaxID=51811 RepID=A0ABY6LUC2_9ARAC|nr:hypothetical protein LAZ67_X003123 [Cordylochernes scorpioides]